MTVAHDLFYNFDHQSSATELSVLFSFFLFYNWFGNRIYYSRLGGILKFVFSLTKESFLDMVCGEHGHRNVETFITALTLSLRTTSIL